MVGLLSGYAVRVTQPLRLVDFGYVQTVLPELGPGSCATGAIWSRRAVAGPGPEFWIWAVRGLRCAGCRALSV